MLRCSFARCGALAAPRTYLQVELFCPVPDQQSFQYSMSDPNVSRYFLSRHLIEEFVDFVQREDSGMLRPMEAILAMGNPSVGSQSLETTKAYVCRTRARLRQLGRCFQSGEGVPRKRRPYKKRGKSSRCVATARSQPHDEKNG